MKSALSFMLIACLIASTVPVAAQGQTLVSFDMRGRATQPMAGSLATSIRHEAARLAAEPTSSDLNTLQQGDNGGRSGWSRVRKVASGTEVTVFLKGSQYRKRHFVRADETGLTVLNLTDPPLSLVATRALVNIAANHPEHVGGAQTGQLFLPEEKVRLVSGEVFVADQKVADLGQLLERIARSDVTEIKGPVKVRGSALGAGIGAVIGFIFGFSAAYNNDFLGPMPIFVFPVAGGYLGSRIGRQTTEDVIYHAP